MKQLVSDNFAKRNVICNIFLLLMLAVTESIVFWGMSLALSTLPYAEQYNFVECIVIEINGIIALLAAYGFVIKNKKNALLIGITTLYAFLIFIFPFFTTASDPNMGVTPSDYRYQFYNSFIDGIIACLIALVIIVSPMLIRKKGKSALSLLERGGVLTNAKIEFLAVIISNIALIVVAYEMLQSEMRRLGGM